MENSLVNTELEHLPNQIPIFPLTGVLLLPGGKLPLHIFEPRYIKMVESALGSGRWFGMIQPYQGNRETVSDNHPLFDTGCLGRIKTFSETDDGRYLLTVIGVCRFKIKKELPKTSSFRKVIPNYEKFARDLESQKLTTSERKRLSHTIQQYFKERGHEIDWESIKQTPDEMFVASIAMACPFNPTEKQALMEAPDLSALTACLIAILKIAEYDNNSKFNSVSH
ncbi:MAG: peptidase S16 [Magnetovibrio sp.]|nr:peptidase S16 [Magnetovibrio sp.]|tara:strand:+ start:485 stop:1156 length:672 start_codon:yes stop_codon:yes gene_type:complete